MTTAISIRGVTKTYPHYGAPPPRALKEAVLTRRTGRHGRLTAVDAVNLDVEVGRTVGLIGHNGAGKSTLLRLIAGVGRVDSGRIEVTGRLAALFELGVGFHPELTGRESAMVAGVVAGLTRDEVRAKIPEIVAFAELEEFIDAPIRTYSSGMQARLAFSLAVAVDPQVLLVDEVLAVGDIGFQARCFDRLEEMQRSGVTILLVSHDPSVVTRLCDEVVWMRGGRVVAQGPAGTVTDRYREEMAEETRRLTPDDVPDATTPAGRTLRVHDNRFGSQRGVITRVDVLDGWGVATERISSGGPLRVSASVRVPPDVGVAYLGLTLTRSDGIVCLDTSTPLAGGESTRTALLAIDRLDLAVGDYTVDIGLYDEHWAHTYDYHWRAYPLRVDGPNASPAGAVLAPPLTWTVSSPDAAKRSSPNR